MSWNVTYLLSPCTQSAAASPPRCNQWFVTAAHSLWLCQGWPWPPPGSRGASRPFRCSLLMFQDLSDPPLVHPSQRPSLSLHLFIPLVLLPLLTLHPCKSTSDIRAQGAPRPSHLRLCTRIIRKRSRACNAPLGRLPGDL